MILGVPPFQFAVGLGTLILLFVSTLIIPALRAASSDRREIIKAIQGVDAKVATQNGRIGKLEVYREEHDRRLSHLEEAG